MQVYSIGYEKRRIGEFCEALVRAGVTRLVDVRERAWSMRPEYRKRALAEALAEHGIEYVHCKVAGNPFRPKKGDEIDLTECEQRYAEHVAQDPSILGAVLSLVEAEPSALFCYEGHRSRCHRGVLLDELATQGASIVDL